MARLREVLLEVVGEEELRELVGNLLGRASWDMAAARLVLAYALGLPRKCVNPGILDPSSAGEGGTAPHQHPG
jgi:hypothetical protein